MAVKTITIDLAAYEILSRHKRPGESFSDVIKQQLGKGLTARDLRAVIRRARVGEDTLEAIDVAIRSRRRSPAHPPKL
ncbi:MAG: antitoxin VapB family protein [Candidatus Rokuibacteriota bacterium]